MILRHRMPLSSPARNAVSGAYVNLERTTHETENHAQMTCQPAQQVKAHDGNDPAAAGLLYLDERIFRGFRQHKAGTNLKVS